MTDAHFLKTFMAADVVNLLMYEVGTELLPLLKIAQVLNIGSSDGFIVAGFFYFSWVLLCFPLLDQVIFSYVSET